MNATYQPETRSGQLQAILQREQAIRSTARKVRSMSANQLLAVELGLFLLSQLQPTASPKALPRLLSYAANPYLEQPTWTHRQQRYLQRALLLLGHYQQPGVWNQLIERYVGLPDHLQAYDISENRSLFHEKKVGFSRNRIFTLKRLFD